MHDSEESGNSRQLPTYKCSCVSKLVRTNTASISGSATRASAESYRAHPNFAATAAGSGTCASVRDQRPCSTAPSRAAIPSACRFEMSPAPIKPIRSGLAAAAADIARVWAVVAAGLCTVFSADGPGPAQRPRGAVACTLRGCKQLRDTAMRRELVDSSMVNLGFRHGGSRTTHY